jgi:4-diphosphocytidyl-2-C-methyl-D-erythritol kinase
MLSLHEPTLQQDIIMVETAAHAKINLHLEVPCKRPDGYHNLLSIMLAIGLHDDIALQADDAPAGAGCRVEIEVRGGQHAALLRELPLEKNLMYAAAVEYFRRAGRPARVRLAITKNIPAGGGLGGGSADAAAVLRLLQQECGLLGHDELFAAAAAIGADVPFCLLGGAALCEGIGEILTPLDYRPDCAVVVLNDGTHVNTALAYRLLGRQVRPLDGGWLVTRRSALRECFCSGSFDSYNSHFFNDFEEPVFEKWPSVEQLKEDVLDKGADYAVMSGSGSTVIALFENREKAKKVVDHFRDKIDLVTLSEPLR